MYARPDYLVNTEWLAEHLDDSNVRVFDVTGMLTATFTNLAEERSYSAGHIPGAAFLDIAGRDQRLSKRGAPLPWSWPTRDIAEEDLGAIGIDNDSRVILYAASPRVGVDKGAMWTTRAWWLMHAFGVNCAVLDGGYEKWVAESRPIDTTAHLYPPTHFRADGDGQRAVVSKSEVREGLADGGTCVIDALPTASFDGSRDMGYGPNKGHITGALSLPMDDLLAEDGTFLPADALRQALGRHGLLDHERVITYCGGGIAATVDAFALVLLGHDDVAVYDASLFEWANEPDAPMTDPSAA